MNEKWIELLQDKTFIEKLLSMENATDAQTFLAENGIELTLDEIESIRVNIENRLANDNTELSEDSLEDIAGGIAVGSVAPIADSIINSGVQLGTSVDTWTRSRW